MRSIQSITKKAIISKLASTLGGSFDESGATYCVEVSFFDDEATVTLDTSGEGLHKRGYRTYLGDAPIRETLAAAMIELSVWNPDRAFIDPFCGSGTIPVEAAFIGLDIAPCMNRNFACESFANVPDLRQIVQQEAQERIKRDKVLHISGFDINKDAIKLALKHAERAGVKDKIHLQAGDMREVSSRFSHGVIVTNPPYGERLMDEDELKLLYKDFGVMTKNSMNGACMQSHRIRHLKSISEGARTRCESCTTASWNVISISILHRHLKRSKTKKSLLTMTTNNNRKSQ